MKRTKKLILLLSIVLCGLAQNIFAELETSLNGAGWFEVGRVENSSTFLNGDASYYGKNWMQNTGAELNLKTVIDEEWTASLGIGAVQVHIVRGNVNQVSQWYPFWVPYIGKTNVEYQKEITDEKRVQLTFGSFHYSYGKDNKNLGLYLMNGYIHPGILVYDFRDFVGAANTSGAKLTYISDRFQNDLILKIETDLKPLYDISVVNYLNYKLLPNVEVGLGVNLYRLLPAISERTNPTKDCKLGTYSTSERDVEELCVLVDSIGIDTNGVTLLDSTEVPYGGTKVVFRFRVDPKVWLGLDGIFGENDLVLYGETAVLGIKNYGKSVYNDVLRRIPVMLGVNIPAFGFFDWSLEWEYFANKNSANILSAQYGLSLPSEYKAENTKRDDWKWSLNASKVVFGNMIMVGKVASDHLRLGGGHDSPEGREVTVNVKDWYWSFKLAYFF